MDVLHTLDPDHHHAHADAHGHATVVDDVEAVTGLHEAEPASLPVHIVEPVQVADYPARALVTAQVTVDNTQPMQLAPYLRNRAALTIVPRGGAVFIGPDRFTTTTVNGFQVDDGASLTLETVSEVWAVCASGVSATVHVLAQVREG